MTLVTWNVNSVRAREARLLAWLERHLPDVVCLQELKGVEATFPLAAVQALGYHAVVHGQPTYNGVAILSRTPLVEVARGMDDGIDDPQARLVAADIDGIRVVCVYVPNGAEVGTEKYEYKLAWLRRLRDWLGRTARPDLPLVVCGDFNIVPTDLDAHDAEAWRGSVLLNDVVRGRLADLQDWGLSDVFARRHPEGRIFTWWDYRNLAFPTNAGLRIDLLLATRPVADRCVDAWVDRDQRKGEKPSDHAPVWIRLD